MRGHQEEDHVVDDFVVAEALSCFGFDVAEHGEQVIGFV